MTEKRDPELELKLQPSEQSGECPPTWEEVMEIKKAEETKLDIENSNGKKTDESNIDLIIIKEAQNEEDRATNIEHQINSLPETAEVLTARQRLAAARRNVIRILKKTFQWGTIMSDIALWISSLIMLIIGCLLVRNHYEITRVVYQQQFKIIGYLLIVVGCIHLFVICPFGICGSWKGKKSLLRFHNRWLMINIIVQLLMLYACIKYFGKDETSLKHSFKKHFELIYTSCKLEKLGDGTDKCCCRKKENRNERNCWIYEPDPKINKSMGTYSILCEDDKLDYFNRTKTAIMNGMICLWALMIVEALSVIYGYITVATIPKPIDDDEFDKINEPPVQTTKPKNTKKMGLFKRVFLLFIMKHAFVFIFFGLCTLSYFAVKKMTEDTLVDLPLPGGKMQSVKLWKLINAILPIKY